jgi:hypothetical protein
VQPFARCGPHIALQAGITQATRAEAGARVQLHPQQRLALDGTHPAQQHETVGSGRHGRCGTAFDHRVRAHPAVHSDQGAFLMGTDRNRPIHASDPRAPPRSARRPRPGREDVVTVPVRRTQPHGPAFGIHHRPTLTVGDHGVLPQDPGWATGVGRCCPFLRALRGAGVIPARRPETDGVPRMQHKRPGRPFSTDGPTRGRPVGSQPTVRAARPRPGGRAPQRDGGRTAEERGPARKAAHPRAARSTR